MGPISRCKNFIQIALSALPFFIKPSNSLVSSSECGTTYNCFTFPTNCDITTTDSCTQVAWQPNSDSTRAEGVVFEISNKLPAGSTSGYAGIGLGKSASGMVGDGYVCQKASANSAPDLSSQWLTGPTRPTVNSNQNVVTRLESTYTASNNIITCKFYRPDTIASNGIALHGDYNTGNEQFYLLVAALTYNDGASNLDYHNNQRVASSSTFDFKSSPSGGSGTTSGSTVPVRVTDSARLAHGCIMLLAWGIISKIAIFSASFNKEKVFDRESLWFEIHMVLNTTASVLTIPGIILAFYVNDWTFVVNQTGSPEIRNNHAKFGMAITALAGFNMILGFLRPDKDSKIRIYFKILHTITGVLIIGFAEFVISSGFYLARYLTWHWTLYLYIVIACLSFVTFVGLYAFQKVRGKGVFFGYVGVLFCVYIAIVVGLNVD